MVTNQQVHPDHCPKPFTSAGRTNSAVAAVSPTPAGALAATKHVPSKVQRDGSRWPSTINLLISCDLEDKQGKNALIWILHSARTDKGCKTLRWSEEMGGSFANIICFSGFGSFSHHGQRFSVLARISAWIWSHPGKLMGGLKTPKSNIPENPWDNSLCIN